VIENARILGLDLSLSASGWAMTARRPDVGFDGLAGGVFRPPEGMRGPERLAWISDRILSKVRRRGETSEGNEIVEKLVDLVAIEGYAFSKENAGEVLGELGGVVRYRLYRAGIGYVEIGPGAARKIVLGRGTIAKVDVKLEVFKRYRVDFPDLNTTEAWIVAMAAWLQLYGKTRQPIRGRLGDSNVSMGDEAAH
jgi:Holliday junction resolvasome RuvABC endonuclease subunit